MAARASGRARPLGRSRAVRRSHGLARRRVEVGDASSAHAAEARVLARRERRVPLGSESVPRSRVLKDIPPLPFGEGPDCTLPACVALADRWQYEWATGAPGA